MMKLNMYILKSELSELELCGDILDERLERRLEYAALYDGEARLEAGCLYIISTERFPELMDRRNNPCFLCLNEPPVNILDGSCSVLYTSRQLTERALLNMATRVFQKYRHWEEALSDAVEESAPLRKLGELSESFFNNPMFLFDASFKEMFSVINRKDYALSEEYLNKVVVGDGTYLSHWVAEQLKSNGIFAKNIALNVPVKFYARELSVNSMHQNIRVGDNLVAWMCLDEIGRTFTDADFSLLDFLSGYIKKAILSKHFEDFNYPQGLALMLKAMLEGKAYKREVLEQSLYKFGCKAEDRYFCAAARSLDSSDSEERLQAMAVSIVNIFEGDLYILHKNMVVFVFNLSRRKMSREDTLEHVLRRLKSDSFAVGASTVFADIRSIRIHYEQCVAALEIGEGKPCRLFDDCAMSYAMQKLGSDPMLDVLIPEGLTALLSYDAEKNTEYIPTLMAYLYNNMNITKSTEKMYIHRNTFLYRLSRIREILLMDLDDPEVRFSLLLAFRILENRRKD